jgi:hypothetical protein
MIHLQAGWGDCTLIQLIEHRAYMTRSSRPRKPYPHVHYLANVSLQAPTFEDTVFQIG